MKMNKHAIIRKDYFQPEIEILLVTPVVALCVSGEEEEGASMGTNGSENPWTGGRAPRF